MEWEPEQQDLGGLGLAGICREIYRVVFRSIIAYAAAGVQAALLSALLLAHLAAIRGLTSHLEADDGFHLLLGFLAGILFECASTIVLAFFSLVCTGVCVFLVASLYCTQGDLRASRSLQRHLPRVPLPRLVPTFFFALALAYVISVFSGVALLLLHYEVGLPLQLLGAAACLAGAAYVAPVFHLACVASVLEDAVEFAAVRKSRALLAGNFWAAAAVFLTLDGCFVALQLAFARLVLGDALGLGLGFQVAAGVATFVALWAVVLLTLAAQPVIYMVCKSHHQEVVDKVHLDYIGEYEQPAVEGDNGLELQPVTTEQIPETTA